MNTHLLSTKDLAEFSGCKQTVAIEKWLKENGIKFTRAKGKPVTTIEAVNDALLGKNSNEVDFI